MKPSKAKLKKIMVYARKLHKKGTPMNKALRKAWKMYG